MNPLALQVRPDCPGTDNDVFLNRIGCPLVYYSSAYARFLARILPGAGLHRLAAYQGNDLVGVLPYALHRHPEHGAVLNSLPFFGSHGGALTDPAGSASPLIQTALHDALAGLIEDQACVSATLVENPLQPVNAHDLIRHGLQPVDDRIGQINHLPTGENIEARLFAEFHQKTRNAVRKGQTQGQVVECRDDPAALAWLQDTHEKSIRALGGVPKSLAVFEHLLAEFPLMTRSRLYLGTVGARHVSGLLVLLHGKTVEYFTPVVDDAYRDKQVLSSLIFHVMADLARQGYERWNWGGTWRSQEGVHRFKQRWGATDHVYRYFNKCVDPGWRARPRELLTRAFPWFYLYNYNPA